VRWRRKEQPAQAQVNGSSNASTLERQPQPEITGAACGTVEATPVEAKASVSLHTQVSELCSYG